MVCVVLLTASQHSATALLASSRRSRNARYVTRASAKRCALVSPVARCTALICVPGAPRRVGPFAAHAAEVVAAAAGGAGGKMWCRGVTARSVPGTRRLQCGDGRPTAASLPAARGSAPSGCVSGSRRCGPLGTWKGSTCAGMLAVAGGCCAVTDPNEPADACRQRARLSAPHCAPDPPAKCVAGGHRRSIPAGWCRVVTARTRRRASSAVYAAARVSQRPGARRQALCPWGRAWRTGADLSLLHLPVATTASECATSRPLRRHQPDRNTRCHEDSVWRHERRLLLRPARSVLAECGVRNGLLRGRRAKSYDSPLSNCAERSLPPRRLPTRALRMQTASSQASANWGPCDPTWTHTRAC